MAKSYIGQILWLPFTPNFTEGNCLLLHSASRVPNIDRYTPDIWTWPLTLMLTFDLTFDHDPDLWPQEGKRQLTVKSKHAFEHLTLTFDLQSQPSLGQGESPCQKSRSKVKWFKQESSDRHTNGRRDGRYQVHYLPASRSIITRLTKSS